MRSYIVCTCVPIYCTCVPVCTLHLLAHTLKVTELTEEDSGFYTCIATNEHEALSLTSSIKVKPAASKFPISEAVSVKRFQKVYGYCSLPSL